MAILVVVQHVSPMLAPLVETANGGGNIAIDFFVRLITETMPGVAVPVFYVISGYLYFVKCDHGFTVEQYKRQNIKRFITLWIPYILWNIIALITIRIVPCILHSNDIVSYIHHCTFIQLIGDAASIFGINGSVPVDGPLYFIRNLIFLSLLSPFVHWFVKRGGFVATIILVFLWIIQNIFNLEPWGSMSKAVAFFTLGSYVGIMKPNIDFVWSRGRYFLIVFLALGIIDWIICSGIICERSIINEYLYKTIVSLGVVVCFYLASLVKNSNYTKWNNTVFFIYASHIIALTYLCPIIKHLFFQNNLFFYTITYFTLLFASTATSMLIYRACKKYWPSAADILSGNRG